MSRDIIKAKKYTHGASCFISLSDTNRFVQMVDGSYGIINMEGSPLVGKRWSGKYKKIILDSRIQTMTQFISAIKYGNYKPLVLINASAVDYYGTSTQEECTENTPPGDDFLAHACVTWEKEAEKARVYATRFVLIRSDIVLDKNEELYYK